MKYLIFIFSFLTSAFLFAQNSHDIGFNLFGYQTYNISGPGYNNGRYIATPFKGIFYKNRGDGWALRFGVSHMHHNMQGFYAFRFEGDSISRLGDVSIWEFSAGYQHSVWQKSALTAYVASDAAFAIGNLSERQFLLQEPLYTISGRHHNFLVKGMAGVELAIFDKLVFSVEGGLGFRTGINNFTATDEATFTQTRNSELAFDLLFIPVNRFGVAIRI